MKRINLGKIIEDLNLDKEGLAQQLFPSNKHKLRALNRILAGEGVLDADQISKLSLLTGIPIGSLFGDWSLSYDPKTDLHRIAGAGYLAEIDLNEMKMLIFHNETLFHEEILFEKSIPVSELINIINIQIENYESGKN